MRFLFSINYKYVNTIIVSIHTIWHVIAELSLPAWQKEARDITYQVIKATEEAKKDGTSV